MLRRLIGMLLVVVIFVVSCYGHAYAVTTGTIDGTYDFGGLDGADTAEPGYALLGDKFKVGTAQFKQWPSYNSGPLTAIYFDSSATTPQTAVIKAEGGSICTSFSFKDLGVSVSGVSPVLFSSLDIVFRDKEGVQIGKTISLGPSSEISTTSVTTISTLYSRGPWLVDNVAVIEITYLLSEAGNPGNAYDLNLENMAMANITGAPITSDPPTVTTLEASSITGSRATLNGRVSANDLRTDITFEYGTDTSYGNIATAVPRTVTGTLNTPVSAAISGLSPNTVYHYRVKGVSGGGASYGDDLAVTTHNCDLLADGGFEGGTPNASWVEASTNYGTPLCDPITCNSSFTARTGNWWAWFGGITGKDEVGFMNQSLLIPSGSLPRLNFYLSNPLFSGNGTDFLKVFVDGSELFSVLAGNPGYAGGYTLVDLDLTPYADGMCHFLSFQSTISAASTPTDFFVDDVSIPHCFSTVRINTTPAVSVQEAMDVAGELGVISATAHDVVENLLFGQSGRVTFKGGYDCSFSRPAGFTTINGTLKINGTGTLVAERLKIR